MFKKAKPNVNYLERTTSGRDGGEVGGPYVEFVPSLEEEGPVVGVLFDLFLARLEAEVARALHVSHGHFRPDLSETGQGEIRTDGDLREEISGKL